VVLHKRYDRLVRNFVRCWILGAIGGVVFIRAVLLAPVAGDRVDEESELVLVLPAAPSAVNAPEACSRGVRQSGQDLSLPDNLCLGLLDEAVRPRQKTVCGLQLETLPLPLLIIDGNPLHRHGLHCLNAVEVVDAVLVGE